MRELGCAVVCVICLCANVFAASESPTVTVLPVERRDLAATLTLTAEFLPYQEIDVHAKVAGYLEQILVDIGDHVQHGQLLATLEIPERLEDLRAAEASRRHAELEIARAKVELKRHQAAFTAAHLLHTRLAHVTRGTPGLVPEQEVDEADAKDRVADAQVETQQAAIAVAEQLLANAQIEVEKAKTMNAYAAITAPFPGVITRRYAHTGSMIQQGTASDTQAKPVVRLSQLDVLRLVLAVPESAVPKVHVGTPVTVRVAALGTSFPSVVARLSERLETATRTMDVEVDVPNPEFKMVPGMYAAAELTLEKRARAVAVPVQAVTRDGSHGTCWRVNADDTLEKRTIELGLETATHVEVVSGLSEGDRVVLGAARLSEGQRVTPRPMDRGLGAR